MTRPMYMSKLYAPTLKEDPADAELASHRLLLRAGMIRKEAAGLYSYLPLAWRSIRKIENIVRDEMDAAGAQELMMPIMVDAELWRESGRIDAYGKELVRFDDRHGRGDRDCPGAQRAAFIQATAGESLSHPGQVPRRVPSPLWPDARSRVHHERRLQLFCHAGEPAGGV